MEHEVPGVDKQAARGPTGDHGAAKHLRASPSCSKKKG